MSARRGGFALVFSMLLVLALAVMAMGMLAVATLEAGIAGSVARRAQATRHAEAVALEAVARWSTREVADLGIGDRRAAAHGAAASSVVERVDSGLFLLTGRGRVPGPDGPVTARAGLLVRALHPQRLAAAFPAAVTAEDSVLVEGTVTGGGDGGGSECGVPAVGAWGAVVHVDIDGGATVYGDPPVRIAAAPPPVTPDPFAPALATELATVRYALPTAEPSPLSAGQGCVADAANWGSPDEGHPCHDALPLVWAADLVMDGGVGHGILVVDGDIHLTGGARFDGLIVAHGELRVDTGSVIRGAARAMSARVAGTVVRDRCVLDRVLSAPALDRPFRPPAGWWVPAF